MPGDLETLYRIAEAFVIRVRARPNLETRTIFSLRKTGDGQASGDAIEVIDWPHLAALTMPAEIDAALWAAGTAVVQSRLPTQASADVDEVLRTFARRFVERMEGGAENQTAALTETWEEFVAFAEHEELVARLVAPLSNFQCDERVVRLTATDELVPIDPEQIWPERGASLMSVNQMAMGEAVTWTHALVATAKVGPFQPVAFADLQDRLRDLLTALRIHGSGAVDMPHYWIEVEEPVQPYARAVRTLFPIGGVWGAGERVRLSGSYHLTRSGALDLPATVEQYLAFRGTDRVFDLAVQRLNAAFTKADFQYRLVDYWVALEALFAPDAAGELRYRASARIARFIGATADDRIALQVEVRDSYDVRSHLVHGGDPTRLPKKFKNTSLDAVAEATEHYLRRALRAWIDPTQSHDLDQIDAAMMR